MREMQGEEGGEEKEGVRERKGEREGRKGRKKEFFRNSKLIKMGQDWC